MDGFCSYNQIQIKMKDQHKTTFIFTWGTLTYMKMPFNLKNVRAMFQWAMSYSFHDIKKIVQAYLDDFTTHSKKRAKHLTHLKSNFYKCQKYNIHLNPHKCIFCVISERLLGFIVSKYGIMVDLLKVKAIVKLPPPTTAHKLQTWKGKSNFLSRFISNYAEIMKGFMRLMKKGVPFYWDD